MQFSCSDENLNKSCEPVKSFSSKESARKRRRHKKNAGCVCEFSIIWTENRPIEGRVIYAFTQII